MHTPILTSKEPAFMIPSPQSVSQRVNTDYNLMHWQDDEINTFVDKYLLIKFQINRTEN